jgi:hypothetical protein
MTSKRPLLGAVAAPQPSDPPLTGVELAGVAALGPVEGALDALTLGGAGGWDVAGPAPVLDETPGGVIGAVDTAGFTLMAGGAALEGAPLVLDALGVTELLVGALLGAAPPVTALLVAALPCEVAAAPEVGDPPARSVPGCWVRGLSKEHEFLLRGPCEEHLEGALDNGKHRTRQRPQRCKVLPAVLQMKRPAARASARR